MTACQAMVVPTSPQRNTAASPVPGGATDKRRFSPLTQRILAINLLPLAIVVGGLLYLGEYRLGLIDAKAAALRTQGEIIAGALGEHVITEMNAGAPRIDPEAARQMVRRLVAPIKTRARLFDSGRALVADSWRLLSVGGVVETKELPPLPTPFPDQALDTLDQWIDWGLFSAVEPSVSGGADGAAETNELDAALAGEPARVLRDGGEAGLILSVAVPVQHFKHVQGALVLSTTLKDVEESVGHVRYRILQLSAFAIAVSVLLSIYLASTIAHPVRRLAAAADAVRHRHDRAIEIPDFSARGDEIGDLSVALDDMTKALRLRMDAIERFAADVSHEIKNPLSSLRSAVETAARVKDPEQQKKLMSIILEDVQRLDRLISDISGASRLDAELSRAESTQVNVGEMLSALVEIYRATGGRPSGTLELNISTPDGLIVSGVERRLVQVFQNLIANAQSFSPPDAVIKLSARRDGDWIEVVVDDDGPGLPAAKLEAVFDRFYSERPAGEKFSTHSGLGLSISKQIVEAHRGLIWAENRGPDPDNPDGAQFVVRLPI